MLDRIALTSRRLLLVVATLVVGGCDEVTGVADTPMPPPTPLSAGPLASTTSTEKPATPAVATLKTATFALG